MAAVNIGHAAANRSACSGHRDGAGGGESAANPTEVNILRMASGRVIQAMRCMRARHLSHSNTSTENTLASNEAQS